MTWHNPAHPRPEQPSPPEEQGSNLATFERHGGEHLRVSLESYKVHEFIRLQVWTPNQAGDLWPAKAKSMSIKLREVEPLRAALATVEQPPAARATTPAITEQSAEGRPHYIDKRPPGRRERADWRASANSQRTVVNQPSQTPFDEFDDSSPDS